MSKPSSSAPLLPLHALFCLLLVFLTLLAGSGKPARAQQPCECAEALQALVSKIETQYPGFTQKTTDSVAYQQLKTQVFGQAALKGPQPCPDLLQQYVAYFKDRHIWLLESPAVAAPVAAAAAPPIVAVDLAKFRRQLPESAVGIEGIWKAENYTIGLRQSGKRNEYMGFILEADPAHWKPGQLKFRLFADGSYLYYMQDHSVQKGTYVVDKRGLLYFKELYVEFVRQVPAPTLPPAQVATRINALNGFVCERLSERTTLLRLPNFSYVFVSAISQLLQFNQELLQHSEFLVVDLRGNGGGTDDAYRTLLPYILTSPVRHVGAEYLATPTLISGLKKYRDSTKEGAQQQLTAQIRLLEKHPGQYVLLDSSRVTVESVPLAAHAPQQVILLADRKVASAGENLLLTARQSKKVKIMGAPTSGVLDFASVRQFTDFPCSNYQVWLPTYRSLRLPAYPIDNIGVQPDIYLDDSITDWVSYARQYLEH